MQDEQRINKNKQNHEKQSEHECDNHKQNSMHAKNLEKGLKQDHSLIQVDSQSSENDNNSEGEDKFNLLQPVWAKIKGYPWWPGKIISIINPNKTDIYNNHHTQNNKKANKPADQTKYAVMFMSDSSIALLTQQSLKPYVLDEPCPFNYSKMKNNWWQEKKLFDSQIRLALNQCKYKSNSKQQILNQSSIVKQNSDNKCNVHVSMTQQHAQQSNHSDKNYEKKSKNRNEQENQSSFYLSHYDKISPLEADQKLADIQAQNDNKMRAVLDQENVNYKQSKSKPISKELRPILTLSQRNKSRCFLRRKKNNLDNKIKIRLSNNKKSTDENEDKMQACKQNMNAQYIESKNQNQNKSAKLTSCEKGQGQCLNDVLQQSKQCWSPHQQTKNLQ